MGLNSSLQIGRSALTASQVALQITGNNFANASTPGYSRQIVSLAPTADAVSSGFLVGRGVGVQGITRQVDAALQARVWAGISQESGAGADLQVLSGLQSTLNELTDNDLSSEFSRFFDSWSELANNPTREGARSLVVQQGRTLAASIRGLRGDLSATRTQIDGQITSNVQQADSLLSQIADLNGQIVISEAGSGMANSLRDQRDEVVSKLSKIMDVSTVEQANGTMDVLVGSTPVVLAGQSRGIEAVRITNGSDIDIKVRVRQDQTELGISTGTVGSLLAQRTGTVQSTIDKLDQVASQLIYTLNRVHSEGYASEALTSVTGTQTVSPGDTSLALNDPANATFAGLPYHANNGGFNVTVKNTSTGATQTVRINVDLDGLDNTGSPGFANDTSVASLAADLSGVANLSATVNPDGTLKIDAATGYTFEFSEDSSGALATLGINTYFTGTTASDIGVRQELIDRPSLLVTGRSVGGQPTDNGGALGILALRDQPVDALNGLSLTGAWLNAAQDVGTKTAQAQNRADATTLVRQNLESQRAAVSGVSIDEESINLLNYQRQYQGAARFISAIDDLTQTLLQLI